MADIESMQVAANAVFDTKELLEMILLELPQVDILRLKRVCTTWHDVVKTRVHLQRRLYLAAALKVDSQDEVPDINPLFATKHPIWSTTNDSPWHLVKINAYSRKHGFPEPVIMLDFTLNGRFCSRRKAMKLYSREVREGSWRTMLLTQQKHATIMILLWRCKAKGEFQKLGFAGVHGSLTLADVYDCLEMMYMDTVGSEDWRKYCGTTADTTGMNA